MEGNTKNNDTRIELNDETAQRTAYAINAFYYYFLTDMFSSGHMRVPRRQLHFIDGLRFVDLFTSRLMHNEDGKMDLTGPLLVGNSP